MTPEREQELIERDTIAAVEAAIAAEGVEGSVNVHGFDGYVTIAEEDEDAARATGFRLARRLRGGADVNRASPTDWHLRSVSPHMVDDHSVIAYGLKRQGTTLWLSTTYRLPEGYEEPALTSMAC